MKCGDCKIEIPGATDILFFKDISFENIGFGIYLIGNTPQTWGPKSLNSGGIPTTGVIKMTYYASDDLQWIRDWFDYISNSLSRDRGFPFHALSNVSKAYAKRKIKMINKNFIFTFYEVYPMEVCYDDFNFDNISLGIPNTVKVRFNYDWCEKEFFDTI